MMRAGRSKGRDLGCEKLEARRAVPWMWTETKTSEERLLPSADTASGAGSDGRRRDGLTQGPRLERAGFSAEALCSWPGDVGKSSEPAGIKCCCWKGRNIGRASLLLSVFQPSSISQGLLISTTQQEPSGQGRNRVSQVPVS